MIIFDIIDKQIVPKMNFLKDCALSKQDIAMMLLNGHFMCWGLDGLKRVIGIVGNMGLRHGSGIFLLDTYVKPYDKEALELF
jgi:hypothetical protein